MQTAKVRVLRWGNSTGILIPKTVVNTVGLQIGTQLIARYQANEFSVHPIPYYDLTTLLRDLTHADLPLEDWDQTSEPFELRCS